MSGDFNERGRVWAGRNCALRRTRLGVVVDGDDAGGWRHPWQMECAYELRVDAAQLAADEVPYEWRVYVTPGLVNGGDVWMGVRDEEGKVTDVELTAEVRPYVQLNGWRNPLKGALGVSGSGELVELKGEGYPKFFESIGVRPRDGEEAVPGRTREIRAMDVVLSVPRLASRLEVGVTNVLEGAAQVLDAVFTNDAFVREKGRAKVRAVSRYAPVAVPGPLAALYGTLLEDGDTGVDELLLGTVWAVSQPGADADAVPDGEWEMWPQHFVWWNVNHATRAVPGGVGTNPIRVLVPLAGGVVQPVLDGILSLVNDTTTEALRFFNQADMRGRFW